MKKKKKKKSLKKNMSVYIPLKFLCRICIARGFKHVNALDEWMNEKLERYFIYS